MSVKDRGVTAWVSHWQTPQQLRQFREFDVYWKGAGKAAKRFGCRVDEVRWGADCPPPELGKILLARGAGGALIPPQHEELDWRDFDWRKFPLLCFGMSVLHPDSKQVTADMFRAIVMRCGALTNTAIGASA